MIYHLEEIDRIRNVETKTAYRIGKSVFDLSDWNSGEKYQNYLYQYLEFPSINNCFDYIYGYELTNDIHFLTQKKLNFINSNIASIFFPSSTLSIVNMANFLQKNKIKNICVLQPSYFSVVPCLQTFGLNVYNEELEYINGNFFIPIDTIMNKNVDAVWITSPIFCTNITFSESEIEKLNYLLDNKIYLICDESLSTKETQLSAKLINNEYLFGIFSPHKILGTNAIKFSCIIANKKYADFFNMWSDLFAGGMTLSSKIAIKHFLTDNYEVVLQKGMEYIYQTYFELEKLLDEHKRYCTFTSIAGLYVTIIVKNISYELSTKHHFIKSIIENTGVSLLPGYLEGFYEKFGFCFRINLTLDRTLLLISLNKVLTYLEKVYL